MKKILTVLFIVLALVFTASAGTYDNGAENDVRIDYPIRSSFGTIDDQLIATDWATGVSGGRTIIGGSGASETLTIEATSSTTDGVILLYDSTVQIDSGLFVHNEAAGDFDFRVEGSAEAYLINTDAANDRVGIGTSAPVSVFEVVGASTVDALTIGGAVSQDGGANAFNEAGADYDFKIEGDSDTALFYVDAANDYVGIGDNNPYQYDHDYLYYQECSNRNQCITQGKLPVQPSK